MLPLVRCIDNNRNRVVEGQLRCKELAEYLENLKTVKRIWLSEDATALTIKVKYDPSTNQLVGIVLPIDGRSGCPIPLSYETTDENTIKQHLKLSKSKFVYLVMAQPLDETIPPFMLQMFGTNHEFRSCDIVRRWNYTKLELEKLVKIMQLYFLSTNS